MNTPDIVVDLRYGYTNDGEVRMFAWRCHIDGVTVERGSGYVRAMFQLYDDGRSLGPSTWSYIHSNGPIDEEVWLRQGRIVKKRR